MKTTQLFGVVILWLCSVAGAQAQTQIVAHRGYWDKFGSAQNSLSSLENAIKAGVYGSELDVWLTKDGVIVLNHEETFQGVNIQEATYEELSAQRLVNGEPIPTLQQYIDVAKQQNKTKLIVEIKPHATPAADIRAAGETVKLINENGVADMVDYISFSEQVCKELIKLNPKHRVAYLSGEKSPEALKAEGYRGLDYEWSVLKEKHPGWIKEAKALGLTTNVWTVNNAKRMQYFISQGVDYITTDNPQLLKGLLTNPLPLHVMTFNIRYDNPGDSLNSWPYRKDVAAGIVKEYDVDLLGTQEVLNSQLNDLKARLPQYAAIGVGRADGKEAGEYSAIFYKKDRFEEEKSGCFWLSETPGVAGSKGWDGACERIATWAVLKEKRTGKRLFFINTHLDHVGKVARREGVKLLLERAEAESDGLPVIITGDFNASPESEVIQQALAGGRFFDTRLLAPPATEINGTFHGFGEVPLERRQLIDYVFVSGGVAVNSYAVAPEKQNGIYLSDHRPVVVSIEID
jgi:glycerophosphoryl diester phosphodiesterase/endonuclease/exonuclease/phosphatase family metal-dependent hydrolase